MTSLFACYYRCRFLVLRFRIKSVCEAQVQIVVNIVCGVFLALVSGVVASVPDVLVEDVVGKQAQTAFVFAEAVADRRHRHEFVSVHRRCGVARPVVVRQLHEELERCNL